MFNLILAVLVLLITFVGYMAHRFRTARMRRALGRDVKDSETLSLNAWMEVIESERKK